MAPSIRVIGSLNADMVSVTPRFPDAGETITARSFTTSAGGKGANQAVACGRLSRPRQGSSSSPVTVEMIGAVGGRDGHFASLLRPTLEESGLGTTHVRTVADDYTGVAVIIVDESAGGENRILFSPGANYSGMQPIPEVLGLGLLAPIPDVIVLQAEIPIETVIGILKSVLEWKRQKKGEGKTGIDANIEVIFNPAPAPPDGLPEEVYPAIDHLIMNETEAELMAPKPDVLQKLKGVVDGESARDKATRYFHSLGVTYVLITLGAKGVWYSAADAETGEAGQKFVNEVPAAKVQQVRDTTAAGDTFVGGYAVQIARWREARRAQGKGAVNLGGEDKRERYESVMGDAVRWATRASGKCVERQGAMDSIPWEDEI